MLKAVLMKPGHIKLTKAEIPKPAEGEILVKVSRIGICGSDLIIFRGLHPYVSYPVVMGHEFSGTVAAHGPGVTLPEIGMRVAVIPHLVCGSCNACSDQLYNYCEQLRCTGAEADGAQAEYIAVPAQMVLPIPDALSLDDAAMVEPACVAYHAAKRGEIRSDDFVLIIGAGPIGIFCLQSCKHLGARKVIIADFDEERLKLAKQLGADGLINVSEESLDAGLIRLADGPINIAVYFDCVGGKGEIIEQILLLARRGARVVIVGVLQNNYEIPHLPDFIQHELRLSGTTMYVPSDYREMIALMADRMIKTDGMITQYFPLSEIVEVFNKIDSQEYKHFKIIITT